MRSHGHPSINNEVDCTRYGVRDKDEISYFSASREVHHSQLQSKIDLLSNDVPCLKNSLPWETMTSIFHGSGTFSHKYFFGGPHFMDTKKYPFLGKRFGPSPPISSVVE
ncbi:hypothetical protein OIU74_004561 [Salix koriyanagi]|uniref:Uncharacterized protein n=1 Tax=Salix koriyanagi TaxID=2511006 RepID=A0A9Q0UM27_9ROSI|nr:hypothetical protein OIU74_004561 [Salix koriyanagi]